MAKSTINKKYELGGLVVPITTFVPRQASDTPTVSETDITNVLADITERMEVADGIMEIHPDLNLAMELRTSMILSPNDMVFNGLILKSNPAFYEDEEIAHDLLNEIEAALNVDLDIDAKIPFFINEALFKYGAHIWFILPPGVIDNLLKERLNGTPSFESYSVVGGNLSETIIGDITFSNDMLSPIKDKIDNAYKEYQEEVAFESYSNVQARPLEVIADEFLDRRESSRPVVMSVPVDVCLPITNPSAPSEHRDYIILTDEHGHIVSRSSKSNYFKELADRLEAAISTKDGQDYQKLKEIGFSDSMANPSISGLVELFNETIVKKVRGAIEKNKGKVKAFELPSDISSQFYQIMFSRFMKGQQTRMLYVPAKYIDYMAFDYDERGIGRSLLDKTKLYSSLRAILVFSELLGFVEASVPGTELNITLDEKDKDPHGTVLKAIAAWGQANDRSLPLATFNGATIIDELRRYATKVKIDGGAKFPNTSMEETKIKKDVPRIDSEIMDSIKKSQYAGLSVPPEAIDQALQGDFAINTYTSNLFFVKRSALDAKIFSAQLARRLKKYIRYSNPIMKVISDRVGEAKVESFIKSLEIILPSADTTRLEEQKEALTAYIEFVDMAISYYFSRDMMDGLLDAESLSGNEDTIKETYKAYFIRKYMAENNLLPELGELSYVGSDISKNIVEYNKDLLVNIETIIKGILTDDSKFTERLDKVKARLNGEEQEEEQEDTGDEISDPDTVEVTDEEPEVGEAEEGDEEDDILDDAVSGEDDDDDLSFESITK
jgi:hypothetical protein